MKLRLIYLSLTLLLLAVPFCTSCEPLLQITVTNKTSETILVYVTIEQFQDKFDVGIVSIDSTIKKTFNISLVNVKSIRVYAKNEQGIIVFDEEYTRSEFLAADSHVVIYSSG